MKYNVLSTGTWEIKYLSTLCRRLKIMCLASSHIQSKFLYFYVKRSSFFSLSINLLLSLQSSESICMPKVSLTSHLWFIINQYLVDYLFFCPYIPWVVEKFLRFKLAASRKGVRSFSYLTTCSFLFVSLHRLFHHPRWVFFLTMSKGFLLSLDF